MDDEKQAQFLEMAIEVAKENVKNKGGGPFGAVIVKGTQVIAQSGNRVVPDLDPTAHAEVQAIRLACQQLKTFDLSGCDIYSSCEPCPMCLGAIYWARLDRLWFAATRQDAAAAGFDDEFIYRELSLPLAKRKIHTVQLSHESGQRPFEIWKLLEEKQPY